MSEGKIDLDRIGENSQGNTSKHSLQSTKILETKNLINEYNCNRNKTNFKKESSNFCCVKRNSVHPTSSEENILQTPHTGNNGETEPQDADQNASLPIEGKISKYSCCSRRKKNNSILGKLSSSEKEFKLFVNLVGSVRNDEDDKYSIETDHNIRNFLFMLIKLLKEEDCHLVVPEGNNKTISDLLQSIINTKSNEYENLSFVDKNKDDMKNIKSQYKKTLECLVVSDGSHMSDMEKKEYIKNYKNIIILKESENKTTFEQELNATYGTENTQSKTYVTINITETWTQTLIAQKILQAFNANVGKVISSSADILQLCIRLNQLDFAVQHGGLWKLGNKENKDDARDGIPANDKAPEDTEKHNAPVTKKAHENDTKDNSLTTDKKNIDDTKEIIKFCIRLQRYDFLKYLIQHGFDLGNVLKHTDIIEDTSEDIMRLKENFFFNEQEPDTKGLKEPIASKIKEMMKKDHENSILFITAILKKDFDLALIIWRTLRRPTIAALYAIEIINNMKSLCKQDDNETISKLDTQKRNFEDLAISTLNKTFATNQNIVYDLLMSYNEDSWNGYNCIDLALLNNLGKFLSQTPCVMLNKIMWNNYRLPASKKTEESPENRVPANKETENSNSSKSGEDSPFISMMNTIAAPKFLAFLRFISHLTFLGLFSVWMISFLYVETIHWIEWVLLTWVIVYFAEIINQCVRNKMRHRRSCWTFIDYIEITSVSLFIISWSLRLAAYNQKDISQLMDCAVVLFSVDFMLFCIFTLEFCYVSKILGPRLIVIPKMVLILLPFLLIILAIFIAFAVSTQAVLYPKTQLTGLLFFRIFKRPFWSMFGDFSLDEIDPNVECTNNASVYFDFQQLRCPSDYGSFYVPIVMGIYVIVIDMLIFNLIIALFNSEIEKNEEQVEELWHHMFFSFTIEHSLTLFTLPSRLLTLNSRRLYPFEEQSLEQLIKLSSIEAEQRDLYLQEIDTEEKQTRDFDFSRHIFNHTINFTRPRTNEGAMNKIQENVQWIKDKLSEGQVTPMPNLISGNEPKKSKMCDKETETDSTKYNYAETQTSQPFQPFPPKLCCDIGTQTESEKKYFEEIYKPLHGRISVTPVSTIGNSILNERYKCSPKKRFYVTRSASNRWVVKGVQVLKRRNMKAYRANISKQKWKEVNEFYKGPIFAVKPLLKDLH